jgi:hypothetical protein
MARRVGLNQLASRYIVYRTLLEIVRQNDQIEGGIISELEASVFEMYASEHP